VTQLPFMTAIDPTTGSAALGSDAAAAYYNLIGVNQTVTPGNDIKTLITEIQSLAASKNYTIIVATSVNPTIWIQTEITSLSTAGINSTLSQVAAFINTYGPGSVANTLYEWTDSSNNLYIGLIKIREGSIIELYYFTITL
jgi:hypothetical protein